MIKATYLLEVEITRSDFLKRGPTSPHSLTPCSTNYNFTDHPQPTWRLERLIPCSSQAPSTEKKTKPTIQSPNETTVWVHPTSLRASAKSDPPIIRTTTRPGRCKRRHRHFWVEQQDEHIIGTPVVGLVVGLVDSSERRGGGEKSQRRPTRASTPRRGPPAAPPHEKHVTGP